MPRPLQRATLEAGLKLNLNQLVRHGALQPGAVCQKTWSNTYTGEHVATAVISGDISADGGHCRVRVGSLDQTIILQPRPCHFGGLQWYFVCPVTGRLAFVLWLPHGGRSFASRHAWRRRVAYASQFATPVDRAWRGQARIKNRLIRDLDPDDWDIPPKPKGMRWNTYNRHVARFEQYEAALDYGAVQAAARLVQRYGPV